MLHFPVRGWFRPVELCVPDTHRTRGLENRSANHPPLLGQGRVYDAPRPPGGPGRAAAQVHPVVGMQAAYGRECSREPADEICTFRKGVALVFAAEHVVAN